MFGRQHLNQRILLFRSYHYKGQVLPFLRIRQVHLLLNYMSLTSYLCTETFRTACLCLVNSE